MLEEAKRKLKAAISKLDFVEHIRDAIYAHITCTVYSEKHLENVTYEIDANWDTHTENLEGNWKEDTDAITETLDLIIGDCEVEEEEEERPKKKKKKR